MDFFISRKKIARKGEFFCENEHSIGIMSWGIKFLLLVTLCLYIQAISAKHYDVKMCWSQSDFEAILDSQCLNHALRRGMERRDFVKSEKEAKHFLQKLARRDLHSTETSGPTNYHEECCVEGCKFEEIAE
ncbi:uncharacterized protein LOC111326460 [Stylophora pistillata]|uniref:uncharacterized protein LOC111326460 n=1 Tax=Stylophora pistillata TaxID=50429 RepID=UPI000C03A4A7|nr:uncharacterized protein LOC111326460 [Stylophora pistillata]